MAGYRAHCRGTTCISVDFRCVCKTGAWYLPLALLFLAVASDAHAVDRRWNNGTGSFVFNTGGNWVGGVTPGTSDVAQFGISVPMFPAGSYTVTFNNDRTNQALHIEDDVVTFVLNSRTYTLSAATGMIIANQSNTFSASLNVTNGTIRSTTGSNFDVGAVANKSGTLIVGTNGLINGSPNLNIGKVGTGTLTVQQGGDISTIGSTNIGINDGVTATATVFGEGSTLITGGLNVGNVGNGTVNVQFGGGLQNNGAASVGAGNLFTGFGTGIVNVMNAGSIWNSVGLLQIGNGGTGEVNVTLGGKVMSVDTEIGAASVGIVNVDGVGSLWDSLGTLSIGDLGFGTLNITNQGVVETNHGYIGTATSFIASSGTVNVSHVGSQWNITDTLEVGQNGTGTLHITLGGKVQSNLSRISASSGAAGEVNVDGSASLWDAGGLYIGYSGDGTLNITAGGKVQSGLGRFGVNAGASGEVNVDGSTSLWDAGGLDVGYFGDGTLNITAGGKVQSNRCSLGVTSSSSGEVNVNGIASSWDNSGHLYVGDFGEGTLNIAAGGIVQSNVAYVGNFDGSLGHVNVDGSTSLWETAETLWIGYAGDGILDITAGGVVQNQGATVGGELNSNGYVIVDGDGSVWESSFNVTVGDKGHGEIHITGGGSAVTNSSNLLSLTEIGKDAGSTGLVTVDGVGSLWHVYRNFSVGGAGEGTVAITSGGTLIASNPIIGRLSGGIGTVAVDGADSLFQSLHLSVGGSGAGTLHITAGGNVTTDNQGLIASDDGTGTVTVSSTVAGLDSTWEIGGQLRIGIISGGFTNAGVGTLRIQTGGIVTVGQETVLSHDDLLSIEGGTFSTTGISFPSFASAGNNFDWTSGTLHVGTFEGDLINQAGVLAPPDTGLTLIEGHYNQLAAAKLEIEIEGFGAGTDYDLVIVDGNATLAGELELFLLNGFIPSSAHQFHILAADFDIVGAFDNVANGQRLTTSDGLASFVVNYGAGSALDPKQVILSSFLAALPGDYNDDGTVDAADYVVWRKNVGTTNPLPNDPIGGTIGPDQYNNWLAHFGQTAGSGAAANSPAGSEHVPEPHSLVLLCTAAILVFGTRCRRM